MKQRSRTMKTTGIVSLALATTLFACKKDDKLSSEDQQTSIELAASTSISDGIYDDAFELVMQEGENSNISGRVAAGAEVTREASCATVSLTPADLTTFPKTMVLDFGSGCLSSNGVTRKGKLTAVISGRLRTNGTTVAVTFDNYYVNGYKVEGNFSITNNSNNGNGLGFTTTTTGGKVTLPTGTWYNYAGTHSLIQTGGVGNSSFTDDVFSLSGNSQTTSSAGKSLTVTITEPLIKNMTCKNVVSGIQSFTYNGLISGTLNYGDGTCDNKAVLKIGAYTQDVTLLR